MSTKSESTCRNCGSALAAGARGCSRCAWNLEAEEMIDGVITRIILPGFIFLLILIVAGFIYMVRH